MKGVLNIYYIWLIIILILSLIVGALNIKEYSFFGMASITNCPYGGEMSPGGKIINARHICPTDGGKTSWIFVSIFSVVLLVLYTIIYWLIYGIFRLYNKIKK